MSYICIPYTYIHIHIYIYIHIHIYIYVYIYILGKPLYPSNSFKIFVFTFRYVTNFISVGVYLLVCCVVKSTCYFSYHLTQYSNFVFLFCSLSFEYHLILFTFTKSNYVSKPSLNADLLAT